MTIYLRAGMLLCIAALLGGARSAAAANATGHITGLIVNPTDNLYVFRVDTYSSSAPPACSKHDRYLISLNSPNARATLATVMLAYAQGSTVTVVGTGTCTGDDETAAYVVLGSIAY